MNLQIVCGERWKAYADEPELEGQENQEAGTGIPKGQEAQKDSPARENRKATQVVDTA
jgi:hypothetical protein